ncbi:MAG: M20/M25/M40 family metallo-hydrolase [Emcibacteraceae bacterium]|nr:M20/M25/M40 family metallo-hydrolase [Emcibacteraceae bacterium]
MSNITKYIIVALLATFNLSAQAGERTLDDAVSDQAVLKGLKGIDVTEMHSAEMLVKIGGIISPSGQELERANAVAEEMRKIGLSDVRVNEAPNVIGRIKGRSGKALVFVATLDDLTTVADNQRAAGTLPVIKDGLVVGPGTNTSLTTVSLLSAAKALVENGFQPEHDIVFAGVAEEETGLRGMKHLYAEYKESAVGFVDVLGEGNSISYGALGIHWWKIHAFGPGGHTLNGGTPNLNQGIARAVDRILQIPEPQIYNDRRTRLNVAVLNSGSVFNHKPEQGWFSLDVRSLDLEHILTMEEKVRKILADVTYELGIKFEMEVVSDTPPGQIEGALESSLVKTSQAISNYLGNDPRMSNAGSANLNVSIAGGSLSIGIASSRGGRRGYPDEWADISTMQRTAKNVFLTAVTIGNAVSE